MTEHVPEDRTERGRTRSAAEIAFREGDPSEWGRFEHGYEVADRICNELGMTHHTPEIKEIAKVESERQIAVIASYEQRQRKLVADAELRSRMGGVAAGLVDALLPAEDMRNRDHVTDLVIEALRPLDERLKLAEWDGVIGRH